MWTRCISRVHPSDDGQFVFLQRYALPSRGAKTILTCVDLRSSAHSFRGVGLAVEFLGQQRECVRLPCLLPHSAPQQFYLAGIFNIFFIF